MSGQVKILYVEDDERTLNVVSKFLLSQGYAVVGTTSPFIAPLLEEEKPDLLLLDIAMPLLSGERLAEVLTRQGCIDKVPILFFSGKPPEMVREIASHFGNASYLTKQRGLDALLERIALLTGG